MGQNICLYGVDSLPADSLLVQLLSVEQMADDKQASPDYPPDIAVILEEFQSLFQAPTQLPPTRICDHTIPLVDGAHPVSIRSYRYPPALKDEIERQVTTMLQQGIIQPSNSPFSSPVFLVHKKDKTWHFCVDYRYLNAMTRKSVFLIPIFDQLVDELAHAQWFLTLDLLAGYHQIHLKDGEEFKTTFSTHHGHFEFKVMPFGLSGAPATFQGAMNSTLAPLLRQCVIVFSDDILVYSSSYTEHLAHLKLVFQLLSQDHWHIKLSKCHFAKQQISYLGHLISHQGIATDPAKVSAILDWPVPSNLKELHSFLGLEGFYPKFVRHFAIIAKPLTLLLKKDALFVWTAEQQQAFAALQAALSSAPVLALPNFTKVFCIETDACKTGVGAVLLQDGHPLAYVSKPLGPKTLGLSTYEKEYLAILIAVNQWRAYLQLAEFFIYTDQKSLIHLNEHRLNTTWQQKVFSKLLGLQYKIIYKKGSDNSVADALSRRPHHSGNLLAMSASVPQWCEELVAGYQLDPHALDIMTKLSVAPDSVPNFTLTNGILRFKGKVWLGNNVQLQQKVLQALHESAIGGHSGIPVTIRRIKQLFAWGSLKKDVQAFVTSCPVCQQAKVERVKYPGLLQPLPVPESALSTISLDFVEGLPMSGGKNCILVVVDKFSKFGHFIPLKHPFTAFEVAKLYLQQVYHLHGLATTLISDRDRIFLSHLWKELFRLADVQLTMSSSYHPQTDGQTERVNQCMETFLRCFVNACRPSGLIGSFWPSSGTTPVGIQHCNPLPLRYCMDIHLSSLGCRLLQVIPPQPYLIGFRTGLQCNS